MVKFPPLPPLLILPVEPPASITPGPWPGLHPVPLVIRCSTPHFPAIRRSCQFPLFLPISIYLLPVLQGFKRRQQNMLRNCDMDKSSSLIPTLARSRSPGSCALDIRFRHCPQFPRLFDKQSPTVPALLCTPERPASPPDFRRGANSQTLLISHPVKGKNQKIEQHNRHAK